MGNSRAGVLRAKRDAYLHYKHATPKPEWADERALLCAEAGGMAAMNRPI
jgi:hypothetical protein